MLMNYHSFLGPIGGPEIVLILMVLGLPVVVVLVVLVVVRLVNSKNLPPPYPPAPALEFILAGATESRLLEIDSLKAKELIPQAEHEEQRKNILPGI